MFRKLFALTLVLAMLLALAPTTGGTTHARQSVTVRYATFTGSGDRADELDQIIAAFEAENPDINIEVTSAPFADYFTMLQADFVAGDVPDVFELNYENFVAYASNDVMLDLTSYVGEDTPFYPGALAAFQYEGAQYALPETFSTVVLFYNKDLFDQAGIEYPTADWTWDDTREAALAIRALGEDVWGIYSPVQFWEFYKRAAQNGCQFFNEDKTESLIDAPECVAALETMVSLMDSDAMPDPTEQAGVSDSELFLSGKLGMVVTGIWMFAPFAEAEFNWDIQLEPGMSQRAYHFFSNGVAISKDTDNPEAAVAWAQFLSSSQTAVDVRLASDWELPAINQPELFASYLEQTPPDNREAVFASLDAPVPPPVIARQSEMQDIFDEILNAVVSGDLEPEEALQMAKEEIDLLLQD
jgi:multiple sugar transport system substrate-binding protein